MVQESLAEALPKQQARIRELLGHARDMGKAGMFVVTIYNAALTRAEQAASSGDVVAMLQSYQELKDMK